ncbi:cytochrome C oxidase subunit IV family protein [Flavobacterium azooxidireducens]|uniref:Cytochrome C oxidase subunit IV family protein n=1 Tax=Flavobacterium azooxidireducens TaxID=1871076 RepID=A0ABY4KH25_9FLAO|nr:cytochrome C oxidase subunit IV family protein [Flavobacterium azooxidireducens]UPQ80103.1 cytochrome C oxidase subunit IV family protein [Flavobacterium azooxidireducens]
MAHEHNLAIFRGRLKFKSNEQKIWGVLILLSIITAIEVVLGIYKPAGLMSPWMTPFEGGLGATLMNIILSPFIFLIPLNFIFLVLTIVKAYYITWDFMHMRDEKASLRKAVVWTFVFLALYIALIFLLEGDYIYEIYKTSFIKWNF